jgi:hypothetical protein
MRDSIDQAKGRNGRSGIEFRVHHQATLLPSDLAKVFFARSEAVDAGGVDLDNVQRMDSDSVINHESKESKSDERVSV